MHPNIVKRRKEERHQLVLFYSDLWNQGLSIVEISERMQSSEGAIFGRLSKYRREFPKLFFKRARKVRKVGRVQVRSQRYDIEEFRSLTDAELAIKYNVTRQRIYQVRLHLHKTEGIPKSIFISQGRKAIRDEVKNKAKNKATSERIKARKARKAVAYNKMLAHSDLWKQGLTHTEIGIRLQMTYESAQVSIHRHRKKYPELFVRRNRDGSFQ